MTLTQLQAVVKEGGMPRFVAGQIAKWLYDKRVTSFEEMNNISLKNKEWLSTYYTVGRTAPSAALKSKDGTVKYLFDFGEGQKVESVYIPDHDRATL